MNGNKQKFTRAELADLYEKVILFYELNNHLSRLHLSTRSKTYRKIVKELNLDVKRFERQEEFDIEELPSFDCKHSFIWFHDSKKNTLKSILYFLRNSAAHGHIQRCKKNHIWYHIEHRYKGTLKFVSSMKKSDFWHFIEEAKKSKPSKKVKM